VQERVVYVEGGRGPKMKKVPPGHAYGHYK
jgi:hypothetical protein